MVSIKSYRVSDRLLYGLLSMLLFLKLKIKNVIMKKKFERITRFGLENPGTNPWSIVAPIIYLFILEDVRYCTKIHK